MNELRTILAGIAAGVLVTFLILGWRTVRPINRVFIIIVTVQQMVSVFTRIFLYKAGVAPAPFWYLTFVDVTFIAISITLIMSIWTHIGRKRGC